MFINSIKVIATDVINYATYHRTQIAQRLGACRRGKIKSTNVQI